MGIAVYFLNSAFTESFVNGTISRLVVLLVSAGAGALIYFILIYIFKTDEVDWITKVIKDKYVSKGTERTIKSNDRA